MQAARDEERSRAMRARVERRAQGGQRRGVRMLGDEADDDDETETSASAADYYPVKGEGKRWYGPLLLGALTGAGLVAVAWGASK